MRAIRNFFNQIKGYPSAIVGLCIIAFMVCLSIYAVIRIPYREAVRLWKGGENVWIENPRNARPAWFNLFYQEKQPLTMVMKTTENPELKTVTDLGNGISAQDIVFEFDYQYDGFLQSCRCSLPPHSQLPVRTWRSRGSRRTAGRY